MFRYLIAFLLIFSSQSFAQNPPDEMEAMIKLQSFKLEDVKYRKGEEPSIAQRAKYKEIEQSLLFVAKNFKNKTVSEDLVYEIQRVTLLSFWYDQTAEIVEDLLPIYEKNESLFKKTRKRFYQFDQDILEQTFGGKSDAVKKGQG